MSNRILVGNEDIAITLVQNLAQQHDSYWTQQHGHLLRSSFFLKNQEGSHHMPVTIDHYHFLSRSAIQVGN
jgi:hypothetical protein